MTIPVRAALYARVSTTNKGQDVGLQLDELQQVAEQRGWVVVGPYVDDGVSGGDESRPALDRMMADAKLGLIDQVVVWKLDRFGRDLRHMLGLLEDLAAWKVGFVSVRDPGIDTTSASGRLMLQIQGAFAEYERAVLRERITAGVARAKAKGTPLGRPKVPVTPRQVQRAVEREGSIRKAAAALGVSAGLVSSRLKEATDGC